MDSDETLVVRVRGGDITAFDALYERHERRLFAYLRALCKDRHDLPNGYAYKYTVSLFKSPNGRSFEGVGLPPDIEVAMEERELARANASKVSDRLALDVQLRTAKELLVRTP